MGYGNEANGDFLPAAERCACVPGERDAVLNGYAVTLPDEPNMINGCLYVDEEVISAYYTGEVRFNHETKQVTLEMKDGTEPVVAEKELTADEENGGYSVDVPVIVGLNDANYEKSLNDSLMQQMQDYITAFMAEENTADSLLQVQVTTGFCTKDFLSIFWEGTRNGMPVRFAKNLDILGQKADNACGYADADLFGGGTGAGR